MAITIVEDASHVQVVENGNQLTVQVDSPAVSVLEQPVTLTITQVAPTVQVSSAGVQGTRGPAGPRGPAGDETGLGFVFHQANPVTTLQVNHGFQFQPAGIVCIGTGDAYPLLGVGVSYPMTGFIELAFGAPFTGDIYLS